MVSLEESGISIWPEVVQYLLRNYVKSLRIGSAIAGLSAVPKDQ